MATRNGEPSIKIRAGLSDEQRHIIEQARQLVSTARGGRDDAAKLLGRLLAIIDELADPRRRDLNEWSSTEELASWLGVDITNLYYMAGRGEGPRRHRIGKSFKYRRGDVEKWLETRAVD